MNLASYFRALMAPVALLAVAPSAFAGEPAKPAWRYSPALLRPFWTGTVMEGESVLFIKDEATGEARASVLFPIRKLTAIRNSAGDKTYEEGRDYRWQPGSREIVLPKRSRIVSTLPSALRRPPKSQPYALTHRDGNGEIFFGGKLEYHALQAQVTYEHEPGQWPVPTPVFDPKALPRTLAKLRERKPLQIVVLGDSISTGCNASGWGEGAPFQPAYPELVRRHLEAHYGGEVRLANLSVGGRDTNWALTMVDQVAGLHPDLLIVAFGMNDAGGRPAKQYRANTAELLARVGERLPDAEYILVATMVGNPAWVALRQDYFPAYRDALAALQRPGVALADLTTPWTRFHELKHDWDHTGNGVNHPNDFGHRVYAQVIATLLVPPDSP